MFIFVLDILCLSHLPVMHAFFKEAKKQEDKLTENYKVKDWDDGVKKRHREPEKKKRRQQEYY